MSCRSHIFDIPLFEQKGGSLYTVAVGMVYFDENQFLSRWAESIIQLSKLGLDQGLKVIAIVVNNGNESHPFENIKKMLTHTAPAVVFHEFKCEPRSLGAARQLLLNVCHAETSQVDYLCISDPDCLWNAEVVQKLIKFLQEKEDATAVGPTFITPWDPVFRPLNALYGSPQGPATPEKTSAYPVDHLSMTLIVLRMKNGLLKFDERFHLTGEDLEWGWRMTKRNKFFQWPEVQVIHQVSELLHDQLIRSFRFGYIQAFAAKAAQRVVPRFAMAAGAALVFAVVFILFQNILFIPIMVFFALYMMFLRVDLCDLNNKYLAMVRRWQRYTLGIILLPILYLLGLLIGSIELIFLIRPRF